jgi:hypothetical protein
MNYETLEPNKNYREQDYGFRDQDEARDYQNRKEVRDRLNDKLKRRRLTTVTAIGATLLAVTVGGVKAIESNTAQASDSTSTQISAVIHSSPIKAARAIKEANPQAHFNATEVGQMANAKELDEHNGEYTAQNGDVLTLTLDSDGNVINEEITTAQEAKDQATK